MKVKAIRDFFMADGTLVKTGDIVEVKTFDKSLMESVKEEKKKDVSKD